MTTASGWRSYSASSRENLNSNGTSLTAAGRIRSIRDSSITQKRSLVTIEPGANGQHAGEHMSGYPTCPVIRLTRHYDKHRYYFAFRARIWAWLACNVLKIGSGQ